VRYFLALCEELNFTKAAKRCNVAQPSITRAIRQLEEEFGGPLVHRERGNTHLSELGRTIKPHLAQIFEHAQSIKRHVQELYRAKLRLGVMCTIAPTPLVELITILEDRRPDLKIEVLDSTACELEEQLKRGDIEVAIYCRPSNRADPRLHYLKLFSEQMMIAISPRHQLAERNSVRFEDLRNERYLNQINCEFNEGLVSETHKWKAICRSQRNDWILAMCAAGLGFGLVPEFYATHPGIAVLPVIEPEIWREVNIVTARGRRHSPGVGALMGEAVRINWVGRELSASTR
jgi:DNA-binding transcriptional LysR family regulator